MQNSKKQQAMHALLSYPTIRDASKACGIAERTIYGYLSEPDFKAEYDAQRRKLVEAACGALQGRIGTAVDTIAELMDCPSVPPQVKLGAARAILEFGIKTVEILDIMPRLEALEEAQNR